MAMESRDFDVMTRKILLSLVCAAAAGNSMALTLGRAHGAAILGQPLAVSFDVRLDTEDAADSMCIEADVVQGDTRIDPSRVHVATTGKGQNAVVKVTTTTAIDEPVVTVTLKAGCAQQSSRRYVLLSDFPADLRGPATATAVLPSGLPESAPAPVAAVAPPVRSAAPRPAVSQTRPRATPRAAATRSAVTRNVAASAAPKPIRTVPAKPPRLQLELTELVQAPDGGLRSSGELAVPAAEDPALRASAAAQWQTLSGQPPDTAKLESLEGQVGALRAAVTQGQGTVVDLQTQLRQAQSERYANGLVYALIAGLLALLGALAYLWRARRSAPAAQWWQGPGAVGVEEGEAGAPEGPLPGEPGITPVAPEPASPPEARGVAPAVALAPAGKKHQIHPSNLGDIQQHADFFVSLGQYDQAIGVLRSHIGDHPSGSPVAYLDLLQIYQRLGRNEDYAALGREFSRLFNGTVPEPTLFKNPGRGLEDYPEVLQRLESAWGTPEVLDLLEALIRPTSDAGPFALGAFRELLLMHAVALADKDPAQFAPRLDAADRRNGWASDFAALGLSSTLVPTTSPDIPLDTLAPRGAAAEYGYDLDLDVDLTKAGPPIRPQAPLPSPVVNSNMVEFDLFDPDTEHDIAPKSTRR